MPLPSSAQSEPTTSEPTTSELTASELQTVALSSQVEMADVMRQNGKIYVVVAVILLIFSGLVFYTIRIDQKISKLEKEVLESSTP